MTHAPRIASRSRSRALAGRAAPAAGRTGLLLLSWLFLSLESSAWLALAALAHDAFGWGLLLVDDPLARAGWIASLGVVLGLQRLVDRRRRAERAG